jgi:hypothetical protein
LAADVRSTKSHPATLSAKVRQTREAIATISRIWKKTLHGF